MIEVFGKDGKPFRFQDGTSDDVIKAALDKHYGPAAPQENSASLSEPIVAPVLEAGPTPEAAPIPAPAPVPEPVAQAVPPPIAPPPQYVPPPQPAFAQDHYQEGPPRADKAMQYTMMAGAAALGILAVTILLWSTGVVGKKPTPAVTTTPQVATARFQATPQPDVRQALVVTQIRKEPKSDALVLRELAAGATIDVLGEQTIEGKRWLSVRLDPTTGGEGYVDASHAGAFGTGGPQLTVVPGTPTLPPGESSAETLPMPPPPAAPSNGRPVATRTYYVAAQQINVRSAPSATAGIVERLNFGDAMTSISRYDTAAGPWLRVRTNSGVVGWAKLSNLSTNPSVNPVEDTMVQAEQYIPEKPARLSRSSYATRVGVGFYVQAGAARDDSEVQDVIARARAASSCVGSEPTVYMSDAFVKTKQRGMALIAYGPFSERYEADAFAAQLRPCISDTFITHQPY